MIFREATSEISSMDAVALTTLMKSRELSPVEVDSDRSYLKIHPMPPDLLMLSLAFPGLVFILKPAAVMHPKYALAPVLPPLCDAFHR